MKAPSFILRLLASAFMVISAPKISRMSFLLSGHFEPSSHFPRVLGRPFAFSRASDLFLLQSSIIFNRGFSAGDIPWALFLAFSRSAIILNKGFSPGCAVPFKRSQDALPLAGGVLALVSWILSMVGYICPLKFPLLLPVPPLLELRFKPFNDGEDSLRVKRLAWADICLAALEDSATGAKPFNVGMDPRRMRPDRSMAAARFGFAISFIRCRRLSADFAVTILRISSSD
mmetsp:Transcript_8388/g.19705  ORF Transcript_8388/g.19705 Transcript_8388/m.19705 type:complete len:230 (-) Transcript_8388:114-803(-)